MFGIKSRYKLNEIAKISPITICLKCENASEPSLLKHMSNVNIILFPISSDKMEPIFPPNVHQISWCSNVSVNPGRIYFFVTVASLEHHLLLVDRDYLRYAIIFVCLRLIAVKKNGKTNISH